MLTKRTILTMLVVMAWSTIANGTVVRLNWKTHLGVIPGMEGDIPTGVNVGDSIQGFATYNNTEFGGPFSYGEYVANYYAMSWHLNFGGGHVYERTYGDGLSQFGTGAFSIRNNDPTYYDSIQFNWKSINPSTSPVNEYVYRLRLTDTDASVWNSTALPDSIPLEEFEVKSLMLYRIRSVPGHGVTAVLFFETTDFQIAVIPEPSAATLWFLAALSMTKRRWKKR